MTIKSTTLRPGLLVSLKTSLHGNIHYSKSVIERERMTDSGAAQAKWETVRTINDPAEHDAGTKARQKAGALIRGICTQSTFGLLCSDRNIDQLEKAIADARKIAEEFNGTAKLSRVSVYVITGRIEQNDTEAVRAINSELRELLTDMETGVKNVDVKAIREAASKAKGLGDMLTAEAQSLVNLAVEAARKTAREINKDEGAAKKIDTGTISRIVEVRKVFLDLEPVAEVAAPAETGRKLDLQPAAN